jgi:NADH-quinone oxidoreductase subunit H
MLKLLFYFLIFPGFLFTAVMGLLASWVDRKLTAWVQWRVGPPWYQPFVDFAKLLGKETIVPRGAKLTFLLSPILGLAAANLVSCLLGRTIIYPQATFIGDLIVILYFLAIPSLAIIMGGASSGNPLASQGASREMKLVLAYELPFILAVLVPIIKAEGTIKLGEVISYQMNSGSTLSSWSGRLGFLIGIICTQAKLGLVPFDIPEAETEIMAGPYIEYSGAPLALFKLTRAMMLFILPIFLIALFWSGRLNILSLFLRYLVLLVVAILIKNTNPRLRIDQALKFFWGPVTLLAIVAVILSLLGL